ncbi:Nup133 N terminal like protein [Nitzschia inconspicua]|uniref:Nup133 N terminal like protein n=1 Tax=Nitzschia inconspicua TaxID=303405 RepID=A0A9K3LEH2_9STRA|nr:Nup133 N terminal like protein [Nitzschia inconspicua]
MSGFSSNGLGPFGSSSTTFPNTPSTHAPVQASSMPAEEYWQDDFRPLRDAGKGILAILRRDETSSQGDLYRRIISKVGSGTDPETNPDHHYFYPGDNSNQTNIANNNKGTNDNSDDWAFAPDSKESPIQHVGTIPLPPELQEKRKNVKISTMMGLFPQGELAWLTVDGTVYLWSYNSALDGTADGAAKAGESKQMIEFQMPSKQPIVSVGLAPPKPGVFNEMVEWCLVVTTKEEAMLCVVTKSSQALGAPWNIVPTKFIIPSDWVSFLCVGSSKNGRIFLGGQDGNLYELDYDILGRQPSVYSNGRSGYGPSDTIQRQLDRFYDGSDDISGGPETSTICPDVLVDQSLVAFQSTPDYLTHIGKRAFDAAFVSRASRSRDSTDECAPPRKCRKLIHSSGGIWRRVFPDFLTKVGSFVFGDTSSAVGGAISQILVDDERQLLYTLSSPKGWICVFDMYSPAGTMKTTNNKSTPETEFRKRGQELSLAAVLDMPSTARSYLESVSRGRLNPISSGSSTREGRMTFLGNSDAAQAGVGGMDGARRILRQVDSDKTWSQREKASRTTSGKVQGVNILTPVSLQLVPCRESTRLTLLAITAGGLRYYLSTLDARNIGSGPPSSRSDQNPWRPQGNRMSLYHIRAPPPLDTLSSNPKGVPPVAPMGISVDASCYRHGTLLVAFEAMTESRTSKDDTLVAVSHDFRRLYGLRTSKDATNNDLPVAPGGICEQVSLNLSSSNGKGGGRVWDIEASMFYHNKVMFLSTHSKTPSDSELNYIVPPFTPICKKRSSELSTKVPPSKGSVVSATNRGAMISPALSMMLNLILGRPAAQGINVQKPIVESLVKVPSYRLSTHSGSDGFSKSAADRGIQLKPGSVPRSPRLSSWLLHPDFVPLEPLSVQHLEPFETTFVALNVGGIHSYKYVSVLGKLREAILAAGANADRDPKVGKIFQHYGYSEGCAMCFMLIVSPFSSEQLRDWSLQVALKHSYIPRLLPNSENNPPSTEPSLKNDPWIPLGFTLRGSALCEGLYTATARLLRPIWYKPAVVVTEGRMVVRGTRMIETPAKVELLLDDTTLNEVAHPLVNLKNAVDQLKPAIVNVPTRTGSNAAPFDRDWADKTARHIEERNIHSLYRLLTRTTQLLNLFYHLSRADSMPDMPEVEWGLLHGIQFAQFVETASGQERIENVLNKLVTTMDKTTRGPSADANNLAEMLSSQCYHYFSSGNRNAFLGFQAAQEAMTLPKGHSRRAVRTIEAAEYLLKASKLWHSPTLITGQLLQTQDSESFTTVAERAIQQNSPLAKACSCLVELEDVASTVHLCLATASNFFEKRGDVVKEALDDTNVIGYYWEVGLYHKKHLRNPHDQESVGSPGKTTARGTNVTPKEAVNTCYSLIFYNLSKFLDSATTSKAHELGEEMVSVCAFQSDKNFLQAFFTFMLGNNHKDVLLRLTSPYLEEWLVGKVQEDPGLLLNYYQIQKNFPKVGAWASSLASDTDNLQIDERVEYLEIALSALSEALSLRMNVADFKTKTEETLELAKLQREFLQAMNSANFPMRQDGVKELQEKLLSGERLLNTYAWAFHQFGLCLKIFAVCHWQDYDNIKLLWKGVICECIIPCCTRTETVRRKLQIFVDNGPYQLTKTDPKRKISILDASESSQDPFFENGSWILKLEETVVRLGSDLLQRGDKFAFPLEFIVSCLEELRMIFLDISPSNKDILPSDWAFSILLGTGASFRASFDAAYNVVATHVASSTESLGFHRKKQNIEVAVSILEFFIKGVRANRRGYEKVRFLDVKATIDKVRVELQSVPEDVSDIENRLYMVEQAADRFSQT